MQACSSRESETPSRGGWHLVLSDRGTAVKIVTRICQTLIGMQGATHGHPTHLNSLFHHTTLNRETGSLNWNPRCHVTQIRVCHVTWSEWVSETYYTPWLNRAPFVFVSIAWCPCGPLSRFFNQCIHCHIFLCWRCLQCTTYFKSLDSTQWLCTSSSTFDKSELGRTHPRVPLGLNRIP